MTDVMKVTPPRFKPGPVDGVDLEAAFRVFYRDVLARMDIRYPNHDAHQGILSNGTGGVTLGQESFPEGRTAGMPALTQHIADTGKAKDQRFLWPLTVGSQSSVQNTSNLLTSSAGASVASIQINSHSVKYDFGSVAYSGGVVAGLPTATGHLVYADDQNFAGGAPSYFATTEPNDMIMQGRYYVGTIVTAAAGATLNISTATSANPIEFTTGGAHGWSSTNDVSFAALPGDFAILNGHTYEITVTGASTFTIVVDGTSFAPYTGGGGAATKLQPSTTGGGGSGAGGGGAGGRWNGFIP